MMKKLIAVCLLILTVCLLSTGVAVADTSTGAQTFYIANENITVYVVSSNAYQPAFVIPKSYYFRTLSVNGEYTSIVYGKNTDSPAVSLYVLNSDLSSKASATTDDVTDDTAYYNIAVANARPNEGVELWFYNPGILTQESKSTYTTVNKVLGVYQYDKTTYFAAITTVSTQTKVLLYKASDTNNPTFTLASIPLHQITIDRNNAENEGVISTPGSGNADATGNNVIRNVMIAVICVMCVLVIFLIFRPTKNAKNRYELENRERYDDNYDDNNGYGNRN